MNHKLEFTNFCKFPGFPEFGINGNNLVKTPNLDGFASDGIQFSRFYSNPMSAPTRASLMTGRYHYRTGVIHTSRGGAKMHGCLLYTSPSPRD